MWLATKHGFYSVVEKQRDEFHIRARVKKDLQNLRTLLQVKGVKLPPVQSWPNADYRHRIVLDRELALAALMELMLSIDYSNFKSKIAATPDQREKLGAYHNVWGEMMSMQR